MKQSLQGNNLKRRRYHGRIAINRGVEFCNAKGKDAVVVREQVEVALVLEF
jgi:hypothetical protein